MPDIRFQATPNPNAGKFVIGEPYAHPAAARSYTSAAQAAPDPVAAALFAIDGVISVFMVSDFVTVTKRQDVAWPSLAPHVEDALRAALAE